MSAKAGHPHKTFAEEQLGISFGDVKIMATPDPEFDVDATDLAAAGDLTLTTQIIDVEEAERLLRAQLRTRQCHYSPTHYVPRDEVARLAALMNQRLGSIEIAGEGRVLQHCDDCGGYVLTRRIQYFKPPRDLADPLYRIYDDAEHYLCDSQHPISVQPEPARAPRQPAPGN